MTCHLEFRLDSRLLLINLVDFIHKRLHLGLICNNILERESILIHNFLHLQHADIVDFAHKIVDRSHHPLIFRIESRVSSHGFGK